jgi:patatin-like phospholipase
MRSKSTVSHRCLTFAEVLASEVAAIDGAPQPEANPELTEAAAYQAVHTRPAGTELSALCLSGGGIRSASFSLGVMQGLARYRLLDKFSYLSTVSGGGYIGSWLTAWIHRKACDKVPDPIGRVSDELAGRNLFPGPNGEVLAEAPAVLQLRRYSNYLAPNTSVLSADLWTLVATVLRNILLNWFVLIPVLLAALTVPRLMATAVVWTASRDAAWGLLAMGFVLCVWTIAYASLQRIRYIEQRPRQGTVLVLAVLPICFAAACLTIGWAWLAPPAPAADAPASSWIFSIVPFGVATMVAAWLAYTVSTVIASKTVDPNLRPNAVERLGELVVYIFIGGVGAILMRIAAYWFDMPLTDPVEIATYSTVALPAFLLSFALAAGYFAGLASSLMTEEDREWWSRFGAWLLMVSLAWTVAGTVVLFVPHWIAEGLTLLIASAATIGSGAVTILGGLSKRTLMKPGSSTAESGAESPWLSRAVKIALPAFVVLFAASLALLTDFILFAATDPKFTLGAFGDQYLHNDLHLRLSHDPVTFIVAMVALGLAAGASRVVGINTFSLHAMYRNRLVRAYLGASRGAVRTPDMFAGFDPKDDVELCETSPEADAWKATGKKGRRLFHVVNMALNLVSGDELAWQDRKAESMTATSLHVGARQESHPEDRSDKSNEKRMLGYRLAKEYGGERIKMTLGTAMAISGAAASPNMGYHSSPVLTFLLTLFNARLGWWLGNPGPAGRRTYMRESPKHALQPLLAEAFGLTDSRHPYIYASDGGHFENLALYEMVRRRCRFIVVVDGGQDPECQFEDLSNAIRKIRSDLGVWIDLDKCAIRKRCKDPSQNMRCAMTGIIRYGEKDAPAGASDEEKRGLNGVLIYIKPAFYDADEPIDIRNYAASHPMFPHEPTADQFFSESQFESYRALGAHAIDRMCVGLKADTLQAFKESVDRYI